MSIHPKELDNDYGQFIYKLKCISDYKAKRELTIGKEYSGWYFRWSECFFITNDYGGNTQFSYSRFEIIEKIDLRTNNLKNN